MLINSGAIILNLLSIALIGLLAATALLTILSPLMARLLAPVSARAQKTLLWMFVTGPWVVGVLCTLIFAPSLFRLQDSMWLARLTHWHHPYEFHLTSWHGVTFILLGIGFLFLLVKKIRYAKDHLSALDTLTFLSKQTITHRDIAAPVIVLQSDTPSAFTSGLLQPKCYVTTGLIERVSQQELDIIIEHEYAHVMHRDAQKKLLFGLLAAFYPRPLAGRLNQHFSLATELIADERVSTRYCNLDIAQTLVRAARMQLDMSCYDPSSLTSSFIADDVDCRVKALISPQPFKALPWHLCLLFMIAITLLSSIGVDSLHHLIEAIFSH